MCIRDRIGGPVVCYNFPVQFRVQILHVVHEVFRNVVVFETDEDEVVEGDIECIDNSRTSAQFGLSALPGTNWSVEIISSTNIIKSTL